jgi:hypothetical protein
VSDATDSGRRAFLGAVLRFAVGGGVWLLLPSCGGERPAGRAVELTRLLRDREAMAQLGAALLAEHPELADRAALEAQLFEDPRWSADVAADPAALLVAQLREEFAEGRTLKARGWLLAATEARLYALVELLRRRA